MIRSRLKELNKTQLWLAEQLGVSRQMISFYAQGKSVPKGEKLEKLGDILNSDRTKGRSLDELVED